MPQLNGSHISEIIDLIEPFVQTEPERVALVQMIFIGAIAHEST
jgi:hypothetical protein